LRREKAGTMVKTLLVGLVIMLIVFLLMGIRVFFVKGGKFPNMHIGGNKALRERGITCAKSQEAEMNAMESPVQKILKSKNQIT